MDKTPLSTLQESLVELLHKSAKASKELEDAEAQLEPIRQRAEEAKQNVATLMAEFQKMTGATVPVRAKRSTGDRAKRVYNTTPESLVAATIKRTTTRLVNGGMPKAQAAKRGIAAGEALKAKLAAK